MNVNYNILLSLIFGAVFFVSSSQITRRIVKEKTIRWTRIITFLLSLSGFSMVLYYFHLFETPLWYIEYRSIPYIEIANSLIGLFLGIFATSKKRRFLFFGLTILLVIVPYIKPIIRPVDIDSTTTWDEGVCIQTTGATCGPSSLATIFNYFNIETSELEVSKNSFTCNTGTEIWYLLRYAREIGLRYNCSKIENFEDLKYPSIVGTKLINIGHFITVLNKIGDSYVIGDPLDGISVLSKMEFSKRYELEGLMIEFRNE